MLKGTVLIIFGLVYLLVLVGGVSVAYHARKFGAPSDVVWKTVKTAFVLISAALFTVNFSLLLSILSYGR